MKNCIMSSSQKLDNYLTRYGEHHLNPINKGIHWFCVPLIMFCILGLVWLIPVPKVLSFNGYFNWASLLMAFVFYYWYQLSVTLAYAMILVLFVMSYVIVLINAALVVGPISALTVYLILFALAWAGQFAGHKIEGKKPSFLEDLQFLLIGPLWLLQFIFAKLKIRY